MTTPWLTGEIRDALGLPRWRETMSPVLGGVGPGACAAVLIFDRRAPLSAFPVPQFNAQDCAALEGLICFDPDGGESPYSFDPRYHLLPVEAAGTRVLLMGFLGRSRAALEDYVRGWSDRAAASRECAPVIAGVFVAYVGGDAAAG